MRKISLLLSIAILLGLLSGCSNPNASHNSKETNPFIFINEDTTVEEVIDVLGDPDDRENDEVKYYNFNLCGEIGELEVSTESDNILVDFIYPFANKEDWHRENEYTKYKPTREEQQAAQKALTTVRDCLIDEYGEPDEVSGNNFGWDLSDTYISRRLVVFVDEPLDEAYGDAFLVRLYIRW